MNPRKFLIGAIGMAISVVVGACGGTAATTPGNETGTLTVWLASFTTNHGPQWGPLMAAATLTGLPVVAFFLVLQRWLAGGLTAGAVKG
jgi:ABC-type glycerol-3-phosphate transport system permease component